MAQIGTIKYWRGALIYYVKGKQVAIRVSTKDTDPPDIWTVEKITPKTIHKPIKLHITKNKRKAVQFAKYYIEQM